MRSMVDHDLPMLQATVEIGSEINLVTGLLTASTLASSPSLMGMLEDRYTASAHRAQKLLAKLPSDDKFTQLKSQIADLLSLADFKTQPGSESDKSPERLNKIFRAQESLTELLVKLADDLNFNLVMKGENAANITNKVTKEARRQADLRTSERIGDRRAGPPAHESDQRGRCHRGSGIDRSDPGSVQGIV